MPIKKKPVKAKKLTPLQLANKKIRELQKELNKTKDILSASQGNERALSKFMHDVKRAVWEVDYTDDEISEKNFSRGDTLTKLGKIIASRTVFKSIIKNEGGRKDHLLRVVLKDPTLKNDLRIEEERNKIASIEEMNLHKRRRGDF